MVPILNVDNACQIMVNLLLLTQADRLPIDEVRESQPNQPTGFREGPFRAVPKLTCVCATLQTKISKAAALKTLCVVPGVGKKAAAQLVDGLQTLNCIFGASNEQACACVMVCVHWLQQVSLDTIMNPNNTAGLLPQLKLEVGTRTAASLGALLDYDHTNSVVRTRTKDNSNTKER